MGERRRSLADYPTAAFCGPDAELADRCADWRVRATPTWRTTDLSCDGTRQVDGETVVCDHGCHELPKLPGSSSRNADRGIE